MRNTGTPFLIRPSAQLGESSSSWRQRMGWANGYALFPVLDERTRRADPDVGISMSEIDWIAGLHGSTKEQVISMTLRSLIGKVVTDLAPRSQPTWWLRTRMGSASNAHGPMYCPQCLAEDSAPYFRLAWRLGFITHCEVHKTQLLDRCPRCACAPWPSGCGTQREVHQDFTSFRNCWRCGLTHTSGKEAMVAPGTPEQTQWLSKPVVQLGEIQAPLIEVLQALRAVGHLFLRNPPLRMIQNSGTEWSSVLAKLSASAKSTRMIEYLDVMDRSILVPAAVRVLEKWPASFLSFCESTGITRVHFNGADHLQPPWMTEVVNMRLALQNRFVSKVVLQKAVADLQAEIGHMPSVTALRSRLRWQGEKGLSDLFPPKRLEATDAEWRSFVKSCHEALDQFGHVALRSRMACSNDLIAILLELLAAHGLKLAPQPSREDMIATLSDARFIHILEDSRLANLVDRLLRTMKDDLKCSHRELSREHASARQVAKRYKALTLRFPNDLARKVGVLLVPARKDSLRGQIQPTCCIDRLSLPS